jgi:UDP-N-acetyl-2-amino-2-deoxyglucuronate dehydrogenase
MTKTVNFALMGCGFIAKKHAEAIQRYVPKAKVVAVCDPQRESAAALGGAYGVPGFGSLRDMMDEVGDKIDVVSVLTPTGLHSEHVMEIAAYGKHVVLEKPMALSSEEAVKMIHACRFAGRQLFVVKQNRYNRAVQRLRQALDDGRFGKLVLVTARVRWRRDKAYYCQAPWRGTIRLDGGVLANQASHHIDLLQWIGGEIESVQCASTRRLAEIEADDTAVALLRFRSGALGALEATTATRPADLEGSISVLGEGGTVVIGGFAANELETWQFGSALDGDSEAEATGLRNPEGMPLYAHSQYLQSVIRSLLTAEPAGIDGREALKTVLLLEALNISKKEGREVAIPAVDSILDAAWSVPGGAVKGAPTVVAA